MSIVKVQGNASGTGIFTVASPNSNTDRTLTLPDNTGTLVSTGSTAGVSQAMLASGVAGNGPAFSAYLGSTQTISTSVWTKAQFNTEFFDTNSNYDTTNYRFTPTVAGYYAVNYCLAFTVGAATGLYAGIYKNGSRIRYVTAYGGTNALDDWTNFGSSLLYMNGTTDYIECWGLQVSGSPAFAGGTETSWFEASLVRAA